MKIEEVEGIVLSETNYSESSKILNVLTLNMVYLVLCLKDVEI